MHQTSVSAVKYESRSLNSDTHQMFMKKQERKAQNGLKKKHQVGESKELLY